MGGHIIDLEPSGSALDALAEMTLVLLLYSDAARMNQTRLRPDHDLPLRLLGLGLPLAVAAGFLTSLALPPGLPSLAVLMLAIALAQTDAALGQAVVENERIPLRVRQALNVESGLDDGLAHPGLVLVAAFAAMGSVHRVWEWSALVGGQIVIGPLAGIAIGLAGAALIESPRAWRYDGALRAIDRGGTCRYRLRSCRSPRREHVPCRL